MTETEDVISLLLEVFNGEIIENPEEKFDFLYREDELERLEAIHKNLNGDME